MKSNSTIGMTAAPLSAIWVYLTGSAKCKLNRCSVALVSHLNLGNNAHEHPRPPTICHGPSRTMPTRTFKNHANSHIQEPCHETCQVSLRCQRNRSTTHNSRYRADRAVGALDKLLTVWYNGVSTK